MSFKVSVFSLSLPVYHEKVLSFSSKYLHVIFWKGKHFKFWELCRLMVFSALREQGSLFRLDMSLQTVQFLSLAG